MDALTIITEALVRGAAAALQPTVEQAIRDGYISLKAFLQKRYNHVRIDFQYLEANPLSPELRSRLRGELHNAGIDVDREVTKMAEEILDNAVSQPTAYDILDRDQLLEYAQTRAGTEALEKVLEDHVNQVITLQNDFPLGNLELISARVASNSILPSTILTTSAICRRRCESSLRPLHLESRKINMKHLRRVLLTCTSRISRAIKAEI